MTTKPLVSVIIPTYNRAHLLGRAIGSVLSQTYQDFELIVVDDASTDGTENIVNKFSDLRIRYIRHERNMGGSTARNTGIREAHGQFIAFQDSDDEWLWGKLKKQIETFDSCNHDVGVVYTGFLRWECQSAVYIPGLQIQTKEGDISEQILSGNFVSTQTLMVRKGVLEEAGFFDEQLPRFQDWELVIRLAQVCHFKCIDEPLVLVYSTPNNITSDNVSGLIALEKIFNKHYLLLNNQPKILSFFLYAIGHQKCLYENVKDGRSFFVKSLKTDLLNIKAYIAWGISLFGKGIYTICLRGKQVLSNFLSSIK